MYQEYTLGVLLTLLSSVVGIVGLGIIARLYKNKRLTYLFASVMLLNIIWFSSLIFNYFKPFFPGPTDPNKIYWFEFLTLSVIYVIRFGLLVALLSLIQHILERPVSRKIISSARNIVIILSVMWLVSWIEIPLLGSRNIVDNLMVFTDFLIFLTVIAAAIYLRYRVAFLPNVDYKRAIIILSTIIIIPMAVGSLKLLIGATLGKITFVLERSMIYVTLMLFICTQLQYLR